MKPSIVIPCYNAADTLSEQLEALARQNWQGEWEVIVADNGSTDDSQAVAARYADRLPVRIVDASARRGAGFAYAVGAAAATGDVLLFCDADDVVGEGWLAAMMKALAEHDFVAAACDMEKLNEPWVRATRANTQKTGLQQYHYPPFLPHAGGSTLGVKRRLFEAVGGFDQSLQHLDTDLCWRLQLAGVQLHFVPDAVVHVRLRTSLRGIFRQGLAWGEGNVALYRKYRPLGMPALGRWAWVPGWLALLRSLPLLRTRGGRARWLWRFGWRLGRVRGSIRYRVWAL